MQENRNYFQELGVFENAEMNQLCDQITAMVRDLTDEEPAVCGSVAKMFGGQLEQDYTPKDIDMVVGRWAFRQLLWKIPVSIPNIKMIEKNPNRIILFSEYRYCLEIWRLSQDRELKYYQNKILYTDYGKENKI